MTQSGRAADVDKRQVFIFRDNGFSQEISPFVREVPLNILIDGRELVTIACSGCSVTELAVGFLRSEGIIGSASDIKEIDVSDDQRFVNIITESQQIWKHEKKLHAPADNIASSGARSWHGESGIAHRENLLAQRTFMTTKQVFYFMKRLVDESPLHKITGGTHSAALTDGDHILAVREDIGRHNVIDMLGGYTLLNGIDCSHKIILRTGRVSAEIVHKVWNLGVPMMISLSVPTTLAINLCEEAGITLIGSVRGGKMNVYCHEWRVIC